MAIETFGDPNALEKYVRTAVAAATVTDIHTHLLPPSHGQLLLWGVDDLLTYHYLIAELFTAPPAGLTPQKFWVLSKSRQADLVWQHLFLDASPISEARRGVLTAIKALGLDPSSRDLKGWRAWMRCSARSRCRRPTNTSRKSSTWPAWITP